MLKAEFKYKQIPEELTKIKTNRIIRILAKTLKEKTQKEKEEVIGK